MDFCIYTRENQTTNNQNKHQFEIRVKFNAWIERIDRQKRTKLFDRDDVKIYMDGWMNERMSVMKMVEKENERDKKK